MVLRYFLGLVASHIFLHSSFAWALGSPEFDFSTDCNQSQNAAVISFNGDILIHDGLYQYVAKGSKDFSVLWNKTNGLRQKADFSVGNLEGPAAMGIDIHGKDHGDVGFTYDKFIYSGTNFSFNFHPRIMGDLKKTGYDLVSTANNHSLDRRAIGIDRTLQAASAAGIMTVGTRASSNQSGEFYKVVNINGVSVAFIACTEMTNGMPDNKNQVLFCYKNADKVSSLVSQLSQQPSVDAVVVLPHWGDEYQPLPNSAQKSFARKWLDSGAIAVVGSHPHVLQPWEKYVTPDGRETVIMYSLGNFLAYQAHLERKTGVVTYLGLSKEGSRTKISAVGFSPTYRDGFQVAPVTNMPTAMANLIAKKFGQTNRVKPQDRLGAQFCR